MRFLMMYRPSNDQDPGQQNPEQFAAMGKFIEEEKSRGTLLETGGLHPPSKATRVRLSGGNLTVTDGPFAEAKELIGGFAIVRADSKDEAVEMTKRFLKLAGDGETEMRQIFEATDFPS